MRIAKCYAKKTIGKNPVRDKFTVSHFRVSSLYSRAGLYFRAKPSIDFSFEKFIVDKTAIRKSFVQFDNLSSRRINTIFEIHLRRHKLFKDSNYLNLSNLNLEVQFIPTINGLGILEHVI